MNTITRTIAAAGIIAAAALGLAGTAAAATNTQPQGPGHVFSPGTKASPPPPSAPAGTTTTAPPTSPTSPASKPARNLLVHLVCVQIAMSTDFGQFDDLSAHQMYSPPAGPKNPPGPPKHPGEGLVFVIGKC